jgi:hypothetical protein
MLMAVGMSEVLAAVERLVLVVLRPRARNELDAHTDFGQNIGSPSRAGSGMPVSTTDYFDESGFGRDSGRFQRATIREADLLRSSAPPDTLLLRNRARAEDKFESLEWRRVTRTRSGEARPKQQMAE